MSNIATGLLMTQTATNVMFRQHHGDVDQRPQVQLPEQGLRRRRPPAGQHQRLVLGGRQQEVCWSVVTLHCHLLMWTQSAVNVMCHCVSCLCLGCAHLVVCSHVCFCSGVPVHCSNLQLVT